MKKLKKNEINTIIKYLKVKCNLCGADDYKVLYHSTIDDSPTIKDYTSTVTKYGIFNNIVKCKQCGLIYMSHRDIQIRDLYKEVSDITYLDNWEDRARNFREHLQILKKYKTQGKVLDIGCYAGIFLDEAQKEGYQITGLEPSFWGAKYARDKTGAKIIRGSCEQEELFPSKHFDLITLWDVIEHLEDPFKCLSLVQNYLKDGGIVAITTHDIQSLFAKLLGKRYPWLMRFHLYHFTPKTLSALLLKNKLKPILIKYYSKKFSIKYLFSRFGINVTNQLFQDIRIPIKTGDMFMIIAQKEMEDSDSSLP